MELYYYVGKLKIDIGIAKTQVDQRLAELSERQKEKISEVCCHTYSIIVL